MKPHHVVAPALSGALIAAAITACVGAPPVAVTVDIFSGRQNPSWVLQPEIESDLVSILDSLSTTDPVETPGDLGFRGIRVSPLTTAWKGSADVFVLDGVVIVDAGADLPIYLDDAESAALMLLREAARDHVDEEVLAQIPE